MVLYLRSEGLNICEEAMAIEIMGWVFFIHIDCIMNIPPNDKKKLEDCVMKDESILS